jgi:type II secretory pathway pseudopilin PulG
MKQVRALTLILIIILLTASATLLVSYTQSSNNQSKAQVYVGIAFGGNTTAQAKLIIDRTKSYTNLFILDSGINPISTNQSAVKEICDYATNAGLNIIVNLGTFNRVDWTSRLQSLNSSQEKYGDKFLGAYYDDEPGGIPLDWNWTKQFTENSTLFGGANPLDLTHIHYELQLAEITGIQPQNYTTEAQWFNQLLQGNRGHNDLKRYNISTFTSDYALFWFDYLGGYDTLFAQLGWNQSVNQQISLVRGAATMQNKDWGTIITWKYRQSPYLDTADNIYNQMVASYNAGAKYITIFDYPYNSTYNPYGAMTDQHFQVLEKFWNQVVIKSTPNSAHAEAALVLPKDYGWGMRSVDDKIWGFWGPDDKSPLIWDIYQTLLNKYGTRLDIIYDDAAFPIQGNYSKVYFWNQTI